MAITTEPNSILSIATYPPIRCDTHFKHHIKRAAEFFSNDRIAWAPLGSVLHSIRNGMNVSTEYYSMEETDIHYLSVSQIKEYGLIRKNQNYLTEEVKDLANFFELEPDMVLITRSGTIGVALSTNHHSFDFDENTYVPSGFVITAKVRAGFSCDLIANYVNLIDVQEWLTAMAAGACQKNISQSVISNLPIPESLLATDPGIGELFDTYESQTRALVEAISDSEARLTALKKRLSDAVRSRILAQNP